METCVPNLINSLPKDISAEFPTYVCLLENMLETSGIALSQPDCSFHLVTRTARIIEAIERLTTQMGQLQNTTERELKILRQSTIDVSDMINGLERMRRRHQETLKSSNGSKEEHREDPPRRTRNRRPTVGGESGIMASGGNAE
ncbi:hypothetical protein Fmac_024951 [Flemingia macrophylla]|uniref:Uncharacterized protein n=1 Tax=Flemingia macrophylla TaxID=520843 RepID=A0ABD1LRG1_9FABA